jgi:L-histidine Nalpha-methyltransferase
MVTDALTWALIMSILSPEFILSEPPSGMRAPTSAADPTLNQIQAISQGLLAKQAVLPPKLFYDALGSRLFDAITALPEYYPPRVEAAIFKSHAAAIRERVGQGRILIDLGAGNCEKAARLFADLKPSCYVAIDISEAHLRRALLNLQKDFPALALMGIAMDFSSTFSLPAAVPNGPRVFFYPGSSIGNFTPNEAALFLSQICTAAQGGGVLLGVDLVKPYDVLELAYNDPLQVTAAFNLNILRCVNRILESDFDTNDFMHRSFFNAQESRIEMHLVARRDLTVQWPGQQRRFAKDETIHTENSYKYTIDALRDLLQRAGFNPPEIWTDPDHYFAVAWAQAGSSLPGSHKPI